MGCDMKKTVFMVILAGIVLLSGCNKSDKKDSSNTSGNSSSEATKLQSSSQPDSCSQAESSITDSNGVEDSFWWMFYGCEEAIKIEKKRIQAVEDFGNEKICHADVGNIQYQCEQDFKALSLKYQKLIKSKLSGDNLTAFNNYIIQREKTDKLKIDTQKKLEMYANSNGLAINSVLDQVEYDIARTNAITDCEFYELILAKEETDKAYKGIN